MIGGLPKMSQGDAAGLLQQFAGDTAAIPGPESDELLQMLMLALQEKMSGQRDDPRMGFAEGQPGAGVSPLVAAAPEDEEMDPALLQMILGGGGGIV